MTRFTLSPLLLLLLACEGPAGPDGLDGAAGADGADGADGAAGADGADGADGENADCFGREPVDLTSVIGGDGTLYVNVPIEGTVERAGAAELTYTVAGYGIDYAFEGDNFTATPTAANASTQVIVGTDGCTVDSVMWEPSVEPGTFTLDVVHLVPGAGAVDVGIAGEFPSATLDFMERSRLVLPFGEYAFEASQGGSSLLSLPAAEYDPGQHYVVYVYPEDGTPAALALNPDVSPTAEADEVRITGVHVADGVDAVDVHDVYGEVILFDDLDFGGSDEIGEVEVRTYGLALDLNNDGETDLDLAKVQTGPFAGDHVVLTAFLDSDGGAKVHALGLNRDVDTILDLTRSVKVDVDYPLGDRGRNVESTVDIENCDRVRDVSLEVNVSATDFADLYFTMESPDAEASVSWYAFGYRGGVFGLFNATEGEDYLDYDDWQFRVSNFTNYRGVSGTGTWSLELRPYVYRGGQWNSYTLSIDCGL